MDSNDGSKFYWAGLEDEPSGCLSRVCGGQGLMVRKAIQGDGKLTLLFAKDSDPGGQAAAKYVERSDRSRVIVQAEEKLGYFTIMRDRAASHRAQITLDWKERSDVEVLDLAAPSAEPDFT
ncbi:hypothetical protein FVE85_7162 [Porphyridium purpureum]|uniref:Uncharacterized protein n=1 Tax=Porphyridium purpureum TaxID=35688 RepID=A0A5J4ZAC0_PORPP|nr:hypothetical protein FVE85_7162 [Porphyridium purpureum]|eukprot:POR3101..scf295_1